MNDVMTQAEVVKYLRVSRSTLLRWRNEGGGPKFIQAVGMRVLYAREEVLAWVAANTHEKKVSA